MIQTILRKWVLGGLLVALLLLAAGSVVQAAGISALAFGDYYYVLGQHNTALEKQNGFWLRRLYLTYDADISDRFKARARIEMNSDGKFTSAATTLNSFVKDAYLSYQIAPRHLLTLGMQENPSFTTVEKYWGYRALERPALDLYKQRESRDFGMTLKGAFDEHSRLSYAVMFGNGSGTKQETNKGKVLGARLDFSPSASWVFEAWGDLSRLDAGKKSVFLQGFAGYTGAVGRFGLNFLHSSLSETGKPDVQWNMVSAFAVPRLAKTVEGIARVDVAFDPLTATQDTYTPIEKGTKPTTLILGLGWNVHPKVQIIPNVKIVTYRAVNGVKPAKADTYANLTFYFQF